MTKVQGQLMNQVFLGCMKPKHLESLLSNLRGFEDPKWGLEQYCTPPRLAAEMVLAAAGMDDIEGKAVLDLGCGAGMLMAGAAALEADVVMGVDADAEALVVAQENMGMMEVEADFLLADVAAELPILPGVFDTVIMNPPFGTKNQGIDLIFLQKAWEVASTSVYSLHKSSTRAFLTKKAESWGAEVEVVAAMRFDLPATYRFHKKANVDIEVDLLRLTRNSDEG